MKLFIYLFIFFMKKVLALGLLTVSAVTLLASCSSTGATDNLKSSPAKAPLHRTMWTDGTIEENIDGSFTTK